MNINIICTRNFFSGDCDHLSLQNQQFGTRQQFQNPYNVIPPNVSYEVAANTMQLGDQTNQSNSQGVIRPPVQIRPRPHILEQQLQPHQVYVHQHRPVHAQRLQGRPPMVHQNQIQNQPCVTGQCCNDF